MNAISKLSKVGAAVALVMAIAAPGVAKADAVAQAILDISSFKFRVGNGMAGEGTAIGAGITISASVVTTDVLAVLVGVGADTGSPIVDGRQACVGACGSYAPFVNLLGAPVASFAGSTATFTGNALLAGGATARTDNTVSLKPSGDGTTTGNINLGVDFTVTVGGIADGSKLEVSFDADSFLRGFLDTPGINATGATNWQISISKGGSPVFVWNPNGVVDGGALGGTEYADAFNMNDTVSQLSVGNTTRTNALGHFEAETAGLSGTYTISIRQTTSADAETRRIPEPGSIALISLALLGAGAAIRRRRG